MIDFTPRICYYKLSMEVGIMGMTNKQFQGFVRLALEQIQRALDETPDNEALKRLLVIFQSMLEDGD